METDLCLVINTCKKYFSNVTSLISQINNSGFPKKNVLIVSGQEDNYSSCYIDDIKVIKVEYTGFHLTSFIYINENIHLFDKINYWLLLPDTVKFGENFFNKIHYYYDMYLNNDNNIYSLPFINPIVRPTMDMGILHRNQILNMTDYLSKIKTYEIDSCNLYKLKLQLIFDENIILGLNPTVGYSATKHNSILLDEKHIKFITNEAIHLSEKRCDNDKINEVYFELLDLYKYQRNFIGPYAPLVIDL